MNSILILTLSAHFISGFGPMRMTRVEEMAYADCIRARDTYNAQHFTKTQLGAKVSYANAECYVIPEKKNG